ncbi:hypothetical protein QUA43_10215 [Microcoleus sp. N9_B4]|uniref:hypothetical protein n=1 Tax=Microcoleus sp. N9_B4 TaxID=3055386 RepID=UPI002FD6C847
MAAFYCKNILATNLFQGIQLLIYSGRFQGAGFARTPAPQADRCANAIVTASQASNKYRIS